MRLLKTVHGWLGVVVLPWVIIIGLTGLFLNHERLVMGWLEGKAYDETQFEAWPGAAPVTQDQARALAEGLYPGVTLKLSGDTAYHGREAAIFEAGDAQVIVALATAHYWIKTDLSRAPGRERTQGELSALPRSPGKATRRARRGSCPGINGDVAFSRGGCGRSLDNRRRSGVVGPPRIIPTAIRDHP